MSQCLSISVSTSKPATCGVDFLIADGSKGIVCVLGLHTDHLHALTEAYSIQGREGRCAWSGGVNGVIRNRIVTVIVIVTVTVSVSDRGHAETRQATQRRSLF